MSSVPPSPGTEPRQGAVQPDPAAPVGPQVGAPAQHHLEVPRTRTSSAWTGIAIGLVVLLLVIIFIGQNTGDTRLNFLWWHGRVPVGLGILAAFVLGGIVVLLLGAARLTQLRLMARRHRRDRPKASSITGPSGP